PRRFGRGGTRGCTAQADRAGEQERSESEIRAQHRSNPTGRSAGTCGEQQRLDRTRDSAQRQSDAEAGKDRCGQSAHTPSLRAKIIKCNRIKPLEKSVSATFLEGLTCNIWPFSRPSPRLAACGRRPIGSSYRLRPSVSIFRPWRRSSGNGSSSGLAVTSESRSRTQARSSFDRPKRFWPRLGPPRGTSKPSRPGRTVPSRSASTRQLGGAVFHACCRGSADGGRLLKSSWVKVCPTV